MKIEEDKLTLDEDDLKAIFSLFTSPSNYEKGQIYQWDSGHYYLDVDLSEEYQLSEEKREYARDAWRAVISFLHSKGFALWDSGKVIDCSFIEHEFMGN